MSTEILTIEQIKNLLAPLFKQYNVKSAVLFGSYAKGCATEKSDVDLLVDSSLMGFDFINFAIAIEETLKKEADVFDVTHIIKQSRIDNEIKKSGLKIFG